MFRGGGKKKSSFAGCVKRVAAKSLKVYGIRKMRGGFSRPHLQASFAYCESNNCFTVVFRGQTSASRFLF